LTKQSHTVDIAEGEVNWLGRENCEERKSHPEETNSNCNQCACMGRKRYLQRLGEDRKKYARLEEIGGETKETRPGVIVPQRTAFPCKKKEKKKLLLKKHRGAGGSKSPAR